MATEAGDVTVPESVYSDVRDPAIITGGCFVLVALVLSIFLILQHLRYYTKPALKKDFIERSYGNFYNWPQPCFEEYFTKWELSSKAEKVELPQWYSMWMSAGLSLMFTLVESQEQKWIVGVLFMVPVYATESFISLWNPKLSLACDILRNCYEAFALYSFGSYLIACLGGERAVVELLEDESRKLLLDSTDDDQGKRHSSFWNFFFRPCLLGRDLFAIEKFGLVQYMILKTVCAFLALILELLGVYGDGEFKWNYGYPYIAVVLNFSQMWALYCLVQFYNVTHERLKPIKPLAKFISFKAIVFATWWQGVGIALLCNFGVLPKKGKLQTGLQDFLICIEVSCFFYEFLWMAFAAVAHVFVFSVEPYRYTLVSEYQKVVTETTTEAMKSEEGNEGKSALLEKTETKVEVPGTSVTESVQDIIVEGGQTVVKDVVLTINQAIEPVEKGVTKIQETFHQKTVDTGDGNEEEEVEYVRQDTTGRRTVVSIEEREIDEDSSHKNV